MSFWNLSDASEKLDTTGNFESTTNIEPIPDGTQVKAMIDEAKWDEYQGDEYISLRWSVLLPAEFKGRKIFQKVRVKDSDSKKSDKAKKMLAAIAVNAGGGLLKCADIKDQDLQKHLLSKPMALMLKTYSIEKADGSGTSTGNWVNAVAPLKKKEPEPVKEPEPSIDDDDIGF
jgi:hypothetical protein